MTGDLLTDGAGVNWASAGSLGKEVDESAMSSSARAVLDGLRTKDAAVWGLRNDCPEFSDRFGWLGVHREMLAEAAALDEFAGALKESFDRVVLCGMGGASLAAEVMWRVLGGSEGYPSLHLLDSTHPAAVARVARNGDMRKTLFVISSKSGTTVETKCFLDFFWEQTSHNGSQFVAVTDPGTELAATSEDRGFLKTFLNPPDVGGRFSALSYFGIVPASLVGIDVTSVLESACRLNLEQPTDNGRESSAAKLGVLLAAAAAGGRDKLMFVLSPRLRAFGLWLEQLIAESTGKDGKGIVPVLETSPGEADEYGNERFFVPLSLRGESDVAWQAELGKLADVGHPVVEIVLDEPSEIGAQFLWWEIVTVAAASLMKINPFNQPNVAQSKDSTSRLLGGDIVATVTASVPELKDFLSDCVTGEYLAVLAFVEPSERVDAAFTALAAAANRKFGMPMTVGYGPRYLHSSGQLHKGGAKKGRFIQIVDTPSFDVDVPGQPYTFGQLMRAQADGDYQALTERNLPIVRIESIKPLSNILLG